MEKIIKKYFSDPQSELNFTGKNVFNPPANLEAITKVEKELNIKFPKDYTDFLLSQMVMMAIWGNHIFND